MLIKTILIENMVHANAEKARLAQEYSIKTLALEVEKPGQMI